MGLICPDSNRTFGAVAHDFWLQYPNCKTTFAIQCIVQEKQRQYLLFYVF